MTTALDGAARVLVHALDANYPMPEALALLRRALDASDQRDGFAAACWSVDDILGKRPDWTEETARTWLQRHASLIQSAMVDAGWETIDYLLDDDDLDP